MSNFFWFQMLIAAVLGIIASPIHKMISEGTINSTFLTIILVSIFLGGKSFGMLESSAKKILNSNNNTTEKKK